LSEVAGIALALPPAHGDCERSRRLGSHLQALRGCPGQFCDFANDGRKSAVAQCLFAAAENGVVIIGLEENNAILGQPGLRQCRRKQVDLAVAPQHLAPGSGGNPCREQTGGRSVYGSIGATGHLVQSAKCEPAARELRIDRGHAKRQDGPATRTGAADTFDLVSEFRDAGGVLS